MNELILLNNIPCPNEFIEMMKYILGGNVLYVRNIIRNHNELRRIKNIFAKNVFDSPINMKMHNELISRINIEMNNELVLCNNIVNVNVLLILIAYTISMCSWI